MPDVTVQVANAPVNVNVSHVGLQGAIGPSGANGTIITNYVSGISVTGFGGQTGLINITGAGSVVVLTGLNNTIIFSGAADTGNFSTIAQFNALSGNIYTTGQTLDSKTNTLSGYISDFFVNRTSNQSITGQKTFVSTVFADNLSGANSTVGLDLINGLINIGGSTSVDYNSKQLNNNVGNPTIRWNNYILNDSSQNQSVDWNNRTLKTDAVTTTLDWSGRVLSGTWNILGGIRVSGNSLITGVDSSSFATITNLTNTGVNILNILSNYTGFQNNNPSGYITTSQTGNFSSVKITGSNVIVTPNFSGIGGLIVSLSGNNILISGVSGNITNNLTNNYSINSGSGIFIYRSGISSGNYQQFIGFPTSLDTRPIVIATLHNDIDNSVLAVQVSGANSTGFWVLFSDAVPNTGYYLDVFASNSSQTGMATNVIVNNYTSNGDGINLSGNLYSTGLNLHQYITSLSGAEDTKIQNSGSNLYNLINNFSGVFNDSGTNWQNQITLLRNASGIYSTGIGTSGYIPLFNERSGIVNSVIFQSGTNIGINTTVPTAHLTIGGNNTATFALLSATDPINYSAKLTNYYSAAHSFALTTSFGREILGDYNGSTYLGSGNVGIRTTNPISNLNISGHILARNITGENLNINTINSTGTNIRIQNNLLVTGVTTSTGFVGDYLFSNNNLTLGTQTFSGSPVTGNYITGIMISGTQNYLYNTTNMGSFSLQTNAGSVTLVEMPLTSGSGLSGVEQSYGFNIGGANVLKIYSENDNISGIQNTTLKINQVISLKPSGLNLTSFILGTEPFYVNRATGNVSWLLPSINQTTGRLYYIKNQGSGIILSGQSNDYIFDSYPVINYTINSGASCTIINDSTYWSVI